MSYATDNGISRGKLLWHKLFAETPVTDTAAELDGVDGYFPNSSSLCILHSFVGNAADRLREQRRRNAGPRPDAIYFKFVALFLRSLPPVAVSTFMPGKHAPRSGAPLVSFTHESRSAQMQLVNVFTTGVMGMSCVELTASYLFTTLQLIYCALLMFLHQGHHSRAHLCLGNAARHACVFFSASSEAWETHLCTAAHTDTQLYSCSGNMEQPVWAFMITTFPPGSLQQAYVSDEYSNLCPALLPTDSG